MRKEGKEYREWKARVNVRDNFICQDCREKGCEAHHIKSWKDDPELRFDVNNGITLCKDCHYKYNQGRPKSEKKKEHKLFNLSLDAIEKLRTIAYNTRKSMSQVVEDLIKEK